MFSSDWITWAAKQIKRTKYNDTSILRMVRFQWQKKENPGNNLRQIDTWKHITYQQYYIQTKMSQMICLIRTIFDVAIKVVLIKEV